MNNFVDEFDDRIFHNGQVIGVKHGGSVHQPTITYSTIPNLGDSMKLFLKLNKDYVQFVKNLQKTVIV